MAGNAITSQFSSPTTDPESFKAAFESTWTTQWEAIAKEAVQVIQDEIRLTLRGWEPQEKLTSRWAVLSNIPDFIQLYCDHIKYEVDLEEGTIRVFLDPEFLKKARILEDVLMRMEFGDEDFPLLVHWRSAGAIYAGKFRETGRKFARQITERLKNAG